MELHNVHTVRARTRTVDSNWLCTLSIHWRKRSGKKVNVCNFKMFLCICRCECFGMCILHVHSDAVATGSRIKQQCTETYWLDMAGGFWARTHLLSYCWIVQTVLVPLNTHSVEQMCKCVLAGVAPINGSGNGRCYHIPIPHADIICFHADMFQSITFYFIPLFVWLRLKSRRFHYTMQTLLETIQRSRCMMIVHEGMPHPIGRKTNINANKYMNEWGFVSDVEWVNENKIKSGWSYLSLVLWFATMTEVFETHRLL